MRILSPCLIGLLDNLRDRTGANRVAAFTNREPQALFQSYRGYQGYFAAHVVPRHHHFHSCRQLHIPRHVRGAEVELRTIAREKWGVPSAVFLRQHVRFGLELGVRRNRSRLADHLPAFHVFFFCPRSNRPTLWPAKPSSSSFLNISMP